MSLADLPAESTSLADLPATELTAAYAAGRLSPVDVAGAVAERVDTLEPRLNAIFHRDDPDRLEELAAGSARRWEQGRPLSRLDGVPITLKENVHRRGVPNWTGCAAVEPVIPEQDSVITRRVQDAGMLVVGSTTMPDWGMLSSGHSSKHGQTISPLDPSWGTGGSSSGAGVAAAAGYGPLHLGTDIGGSIRLPGTWLGLATLKPSAGRIPLHAPYLGRVAGPMSRSAADGALLMEVLSGPDPMDWTSLPEQQIDWRATVFDPQDLRVAVWTDAGYGMPADPHVASVSQDVAERLAAAGAVAHEVEPWLTQDLLDGVNLFWQVRSWADFNRIDEVAQDKVLPYVADWVREGARASGLDVMDGYHAFYQVQARTVEMWQALGDPDLLISPAAPCAAPDATLPMPFPEDGHGMWHINFTMPWNMTGQPAGTVNGGAMPDGRPVGVQVVGRPFDDGGVLRAMTWLQGG